MNYKWDGNLKIRLFGDALFCLFFWMYFPFLALYFAQTLGGAVAGFMMMVPPILTLIVSLIAGAIADRYGRRKLMLSGTLLMLVMFLFFAFLDNEIWQYIAFLGITAGQAMYKPASDAMVADIVPAYARKNVFAVFTTFNNIGAVLGPILGATLFFKHQQSLLIGCSIVLAIYFVLIFVRLKETLPSRLEPSSFSLRTTLKSYRIIFEEKTFLLYIVAGVCAVIVFTQLDLYLAVYLSTEVPAQTLFGSFDVSGKEIFGWLLGVNGLMFVVLVYPLTVLLKNWSDRNVFVFSGLLGGFGFWGMGLFDSFWWLLAMVIVFTVGELIRGPVMFNFVASFAPENARAQYMAAANLQFTLGRILAPLLVTLSAKTSSTVVLSVLLGFGLLSCVLYVVLFKRIGRE